MKKSPGLKIILILFLESKNLIIFVNLIWLLVYLMLIFRVILSKKAFLDINVIDWSNLKLCKG